MFFAAILGACQSATVEPAATLGATPTATTVAVEPTQTPTLTPPISTEGTPVHEADVVVEPTATATHESIAVGLPNSDGASGQDAGCVSDPTPVLTVAHTELDKIDFMMPMIVPSGNWLKNRSYFVIGTDPATGDAYDVPVYAPVDMTLYGITRYIESARDFDGNVLEQDQYDLRFHVSCEVELGFDHVGRLVGAALELQPAEAARTTRDSMKSVRIAYTAGDLIGYSQGTGMAHTFDFLMTNSGSTIQYANQERYETMGELSRLRQATCPYDYYIEPMRSQYFALFGGWAGLMIGADECFGSPDVPGTLAGGWFGSPFELGTEFAVVDWALAVVPTADGRVEVNDAQRSVRADPDDPTNLAPGLVTTEHCYQDYRSPASFAYLKLLSADEIAYALADGPCPSSLPTDFSVAYR